jgi:hypothetical protein
MHSNHFVPEHSPHISYHGGDVRSDICQLGNRGMKVVMIEWGQVENLAKTLGLSPQILTITAMEFSMTTDSGLPFNDSFERLV